jgi:hypothetical protein
LRNKSTSEIVLSSDAIVSDSYCSNRLHIRRNVRVLTMELSSVPNYVLISLGGLMPWNLEVHTSLRVFSNEGRVARNATYFPIICFIVGRSAGLCFQQSLMSFQIPSSITGRFNRAGRNSCATSQGICNRRFS